uniref:cell cycle checkpoint control protein RAD9B isoform X3 n=1 Tax=Scatophagus argus TaxID=75038 RepID=UPI001ED86466|nr:cell cycle checkpoint control protein RAD9B isoform X3 [Scatophagus argus]
MNCLLDGNGVKAFGKAVHALSRIGDELWLDPMVNGLALRAVNSAHTAYACFLFSPLFFQQYSLGSVFKQGSEIVKCKLLVKCVLPLFRCLTSIERNVEWCQIQIRPPNDRVVIQFFCRHGITKTHNLHFQESEALQAVFPSHFFPNVLKAPARLFRDMVMHFPVSQEEITLSTTPLRVSLRNDCEEGKDHMKMMYTEMSLHPNEFDLFRVGADSDITFCLKELRGLLSFADSHCLPVSVLFGAAGKCTDAAVLPVDSCESDSMKPQGAPAAMELIPSSQGSPLIIPPGLTVLLPQTDHPNGLTEPDGACASATTTPPSSMICSLLFSALSELNSDGCTTSLPVLAYHSDGEENMEEDHTGSPSL